ncbi:hypothetical protein [Leifsonia aquatica]|uniref:hypothetical protein n=1 Tax=Leifsonia aquatica TaxID=144185 RepID=UPI0013B41F44|nr:hypothetical protein [Leifsonia aquatica]
MRTRTASVVLTVGLLSLSMLIAGCSPTGCSGRSQTPPSVIIDPSGWFQAHPQSEVEACLDDGKCVSLKETHQVVASGSVGERTTFALHVTATEAGKQAVTTKEDVPIPVNSLSTPGCGDSETQSLNMRLDATGQLQTID